MTSKELAALMDGREYMSEITKDEERRAKESGLIAIFGASDDLVEFRGVLSDEIGAYNGTSFALNSKGEIALEINREDEEVLEKYGLVEIAKQRFAEAHHFTATWRNDAPPWAITRDQGKGEAFTIMEDGEPFCRGLVVSLEDLRPMTESATGG